MSPSCIWILWSYPVIKKIQNGHIDGVTRKKMGKINDVMEVLECVLFFLKMSGKKVDHDHYPHENVHLKDIYPMFRQTKTLFL